MKAWVKLAIPTTKYLLNLGFVTGNLSSEAELKAVWYHFGFVYSCPPIITGFYRRGCGLTKKIAVSNILNRVAVAKFGFSLMLALFGYGYSLMLALFRLASRNTLLRPLLTAI